MSNVFGRPDLRGTYGATAVQQNTAQQAAQSVAHQAAQHVAQQAALGTEIESLKTENAKLKKELSKIRATSGPIGTVIAVVGKMAYLAVGSAQYRTVEISEGLEIGPGDSALCAKKDDVMLVVERLPFPKGGGRAVVVEKLHDGGLVEYGVAGDRRVVRAGSLDGSIKVNDHVLLDPGSEIVVKILSRTRSKSHTAVTGVSWDDVGGLDDVKMILREAIEDPIQYRSLYERFGLRAPKGMVLEGPSGTGKNMLAKACWTSLAKTHGKSASDSGYIYVRGPELLNKFIGETEASIRLLFTTAREHFSEHGYPAIIFLDEADGLLAQRGRSLGLEGMERTVVPQFLAEMDGLEETCAFILVATNRMEILDSALLRQGRLDRKVTIGRPNFEASKSILRAHLKRRPCDVEDLVEYGVKLAFSENLVHRKLRLKNGSTRDFLLRHVMSGALLAGLVERSTEIAVRRAKAGAGEQKILRSDMDDGIKVLLREERLNGQEAELIRLTRLVKGTDREIVSAEMPDDETKDAAA